MDMEKWEVRRSEEYQKYMKALCRMACRWVPEIRIQYAEKAFEMYKDESVRKLVLAYGEEAEKLDADRLRDFCNADEHFDDDFWGKYEVNRETYLRDSCLIHADEYAQAAFLLFDINLRKEKSA